MIACLLGKALTNVDHFVDKLNGSKTDPNFKEALMMLNEEDILNVSEMPRPDQTKHIKQVQKPPSASYQQVVSVIGMMLSYLQYFVSSLDIDGNRIYDEDKLVLSEDNYQKVLFGLSLTAWYNQLTVDGKNMKCMIPPEIEETFRQIKHQKKHVEVQKQRHNQQLQ
eukprot:7931329-Ditylum_brightwellii.AAC.1